MRYRLTSAAKPSASNTFAWLPCEDQLAGVAAADAFAAMDCIPQARHFLVALAIPQQMRSASNANGSFLRVMQVTYTQWV